MTEYIERDDVLKTTDILDDYLNDFERLYFIKAIKNIPAADVVKVKHSKWVGISDYGNGNCIAYCDKCGTTIKAKNPTALKMFHKYCHWCGAKMDLKGDANNE